MENLIKESLEKSFTYEAYKLMNNEMLAQGITTGEVQSEELLHYTKLNVQRMKRLDKTAVLLDEVASKIESLSKKYVLLVLTEAWCGDASQTLPVINKMVEASDMLDLRVVLRDENKELMNHFLTNGGMSIPKIILLDAETFAVIGDWGPRPQGATDEVIRLKELFGGITDEVKEGLQKWYNQDKGFSAQKEIISLLKNSVE